MLYYKTSGLTRFSRQKIDKKEITMSVQKKSLIGNRTVAKKALVAKSAGKVADPTKIASPVNVKALHAPIKHPMLYKTLSRTAF
jgi:hypothetical protein